MMIRRNLLAVLAYCCLGCLLSCGGNDRLPDGKEIAASPDIYPDYKEVTFPVNVAPPNFRLESPHEEAYACFRTPSQELVVKERKGYFSIPEKGWKKLLADAKGEIEVTIYAKDKEWVRYSAFRQYVSTDSIDSHLVYRLIEPGYEMWNNMGIYQRELSSYDQSPVMENRLTDQNCMNCHSFSAQDPDKMIFHMRGKNNGTYLIKGDKIEKLNTKTDHTMSTLVYPSWHPGGRYIAFSVNQTNQSFHQTNRNRIEVYDSASDVVVYDTENHEIVSSDLLMSKDRFENCPTFSSDGKRLYFCSAQAREMPKEFEQVRFDLCSIAFDPATGTFGTEVDTLYKASDYGKSISWPRLSPDGRHLLLTIANYGYFMIWNKSADLYMLDLTTKELNPLTLANSPDVESYHSWSSNGRWAVFSSRRDDGLYTRLYITHIDENGEASKAFMLPQEDPGYYHSLMKSYNVPEFVKGEVKDRMRELAIIAKDDPGIQLTFRE